MSVKDQALLLQQQSSPLFISTLSSLTSTLLAVKPVVPSSSVDLSYLLTALEILIGELKKHRENSVNLTTDQNRNFLGTVQNVDSLFGTRTLISNRSAGFIYLNPNSMYLLLLSSLFRLLDVTSTFCYIGELLLELGLLRHSHAFLSETVYRAASSVRYPSLGHSDKSPVRLTPLTSSADSAGLLLRAHMALAVLLYLEGRDNEAILHLKEAFAIPANPSVFAAVARFDENLLFYGLY
jgi:hypothetical protein